jgi:hypothetical protein
MVIAAAAPFPVLPFVIVLGLVLLLASSAYVVSQVWDKEPWFRKSPKPGREYKNAKDQVKIYNLMQKNPDAFNNFDPGKIMKTGSDEGA